MRKREKNKVLLESVLNDVLAHAGKGGIPYLTTLSYLFPALDRPECHIVPADMECLLLFESASGMDLITRILFSEESLYRESISDHVLTHSYEVGWLYLITFLYLIQRLYTV